MVTNLSFPPVLLQSLHLFRIRSAIAQSPIDSDQLGMRNRYDSALASPPELQSLVAHLEKGFLVCCSRPCGLRQSCAQPTVALSRSPAFSFASTFIVTWTNCGPGCQMMTVGKRPFWTHVHSRLCQDAG